MIYASCREMPDGLALVVGVMTVEEVRAADWSSDNADVPEGAYAALVAEFADAGDPVDGGAR